MQKRLPREIQYKERARECRRFAETAPERMRDGFLRLAEIYEKLAHRPQRKPRPDPGAAAKERPTSGPLRALVKRRFETTKKAKPPLHGGHGAEAISKPGCGIGGDGGRPGSDWLKPLWTKRSFFGMVGFKLVRLVLLRVGQWTFMLKHFC